jgi:hypothetical protein
MIERALAVGLALPGVKAGAKGLQLRGRFLAGPATHQSAEPDSLVVRYGIADRAFLLAERPEGYYLTDYYRRHPVLLVRLAKVDDGVLRDLLLTSWRMTAAR